VFYGLSESISAYVLGSISFTMVDAIAKTAGT